MDVADAAKSGGGIRFTHESPVHSKQDAGLYEESNILEVFESKQQQWRIKSCLLQYKSEIWD